MLGMSRMVSVIMLLVYGAYLFFQLKTHTFLFEGDEEDDEEPVLGFYGAMGWMTVLTLFISILSGGFCPLYFRRRTPLLAA